MNSSKNKFWSLVNELSLKKGITEIIINEPDKIFVEKEGKLLQLEFSSTLEELNEFVADLAEYNKAEFDQEHPILDGHLPDGSRINILNVPYTEKSPAVTIRRYIKSIKRFEQNTAIFALNEPWIHLFQTMVAAKVNLVVSGGTGVGKTTFLNLLLQEVSKKERIITIEDTRELNFNHPNLLQLETAGSGSLITGLKKLSIRDLIKNTLRMRPDRIIIGEVRGGEIFDLLQAMNTGHDGSMTSIHANSPGECLKRIATLYLTAGFEVPLQAIRDQIVTAVDFLIQLGKTADGERIVLKVAELTGMEGGHILSQDIGVYQNGRLCSTGFVPSCMERLIQAGLPKNYFNNDF